MLPDMSKIWDQALPHTPLTIAQEHSHLTVQGVQVFDQLLDSQEHFRITWDTQRAVGTMQGAS